MVASASGVSKTRSAAELLLQAVGDAEDAAELAHILTKDQDATVAVPGVMQREIERLAHVSVERSS